MGETQSDYGQGAGDSSAWDHLETLRGRQRQRVLAIQLADIYFEAARCYARLRGWHGPQATKLLAKASRGYRAAGLTRRAKASQRYARVIRRATTEGQR